MRIRPTFAGCEWFLAKQITFIIMHWREQTGINASMMRCDKCGKEGAELKKCAYCEKAFCPEHYDEHMSWERRHTGLAEESGRFWRKKSDQPE
jgi:hypothetical protein